MSTKTKNAKPIFKTSSPFTETLWPIISHEDQQAILELACSLLAPIGEHRKSHSTPSRGTKRKHNSKSHVSEETPAPAAPPAISTDVLIGINSITRLLESLAAKSAPSTCPAGKQESTTPTSQSAGTTQPSTKDPDPVSRRLSLIIIPHPSPSSSPAHAHISTLLHLANLQHSTSEQSTRLVTLPTTADLRLAQALHIPRVGALAIFEGASGAKGLEEFVREKVGATECRWVDEAMRAEWKGTNVKRG